MLTGCDKLNSKPIRILHIVGIMNMGGLENFLMNVYRNIDRNKIQFDFLVTREEKGIFDEEIKVLGGYIYDIPKMEIVGYNKYSKILYDFFKNHNEYKIVHCHRDALCSVYLKQAKKANIPVRIAHSHNTDIIEDKNFKGYIKILTKNILKKKVNKYATNFFACSREAGLWLFGKRIANEDLVIIKNGINLKKYEYSKNIAENIRSELNIDKETFLIGHVGRFDLQKNHKFLVDLIKEVNKSIDNYKVCLVGDGHLKAEIINLVKQYRLEDKFLFLGIRNNVNELMMAFDLFLFPSLFEGLGIVLIEAQSTGLKCLISDNIPREVDMNLGLVQFLNIDNKNEWIDRICYTYKNRNRLCINSSRSSTLKKVKEYGYDIFDVSNYLTEFYIEAIEND